MLNSISIVIPTIKFTPFLDEAIESCFTIKHIQTRIFVNINSENKNEFKQSKFYNCKSVKWNLTGIFHASMAVSIRSAIQNSTGDWIFVLSDDDKILPGFLKGVDLEEFTEKTIYATRINIIDEDSNQIKINKEHQKVVFTKDQFIQLFFDNKFQNHLSLFVFHRKMYNSVGGFVNTGYPNGYYIDTVFHGKVIANCDKVISSQEVVFSRRETTYQGSAKFYFGKEVNEYFKTILNALLENEAFNIEMVKRYRTRENFFKILLKQRFFIEINKLNNPIFNKSLTTILWFEYNFLRYWNVDFKFKLYSIIYFLKPTIINHIPKRIKEIIKAFRHTCILKLSGLYRKVS